MENSQSASNTSSFSSNCSVICSDEPPDLLHELTYSRFLFHVAKTPHVMAFMCIFSILAIIGNATVIAWRCAQRREERFSAVSILIINMSLADFTYGLHKVLFASALLRTDRWCDTGELSISLCRVAGILDHPSNVMPWILTVTIAILAFHGLVGCFGSPAAEFSPTKITFIVLVEWLLAVTYGIVVSVLDSGKDSLDVANLGNITDWSHCWRYYRGGYFNSTRSRYPALAYYVAEGTGVILATILYVSMLIKLCCLKARQSTFSEQSTFATSLGFRLVAIVSVTLLSYFHDFWRLYALFQTEIQLTCHDFHTQMTTGRLADYFETSAATLITTPMFAAFNPILYTLLTKPVLSRVKRAFKFLFHKRRNKFSNVLHQSEFEGDTRHIESTNLYSEVLTEDELSDFSY